MAPLSAEVQAYRELAARMQDLIGQLSWDAYCIELQKVEKDLVERLVGNRGAENDDIIRGKIEGLREAVHMPGNIIRRAKGMSE